MQKMIVYKVNRKPHPQQEYLNSRVRFAYSAKVTHYDDSTIGILVSERRKRSDGEMTTNMKKLKEYMKVFLKERNVEWEIIDECRMD